MCNDYIERYNEFSRIHCECTLPAATRRSQETIHGFAVDVRPRCRMYLHAHQRRPLLRKSSGSRRE